jgi:Protein of unknown function (DUF3455)
MSMAIRAGFDPTTGQSSAVGESSIEGCDALKNQTLRRIWVIACATCLAAAFTASLPQPARARNITPPPVPSDIQVPQGNFAFREVGTQNYICLPSDGSFKFVPFTPEATLFDGLDKQVTTHFFSATPSEDTSVAWGGTAIPSSDPKFVAPDAIPWLKLPMAGVQVGPRGGETLTATTFIQRLNTSGGVAPAEDCTSMNDIGKEAFVPYTADYFFYTDGQKRRGPR